MRSQEQSNSVKRLYKGPLFTLDSHEVILPDGRLAQRDVITHRGASAVLACVDDKILLVRQYRKAIEQETLEIPAGTLEMGESFESCARRELQEETGYAAQDFQHLVTMAVSPGYLTEKIAIYQALGLKRVAGQQLDADEFVQVEALSLSECHQAIAEGRICDAKTLYAIQYLDLLGARK